MAVLGAVWSGCGAGLLGVPVGGGPPARSPHASLRLGAIDLEARPGPAAADGHRSQALPPPMGPQSGPAAAHGPAVRPSGPSGALHTSGALLADGARCVVSKAGLASPPPMGPQSGRADQAAGCLKPVSPLLMCGCVGLKPASPLRVRNGCFWCGFWVQW